MRQPPKTVIFALTAVLTAVLSPAKSTAQEKEKEAAAPVQYKQLADKLFLVKGDVSKGSGFICEIGGKPVCLTNAHVISGNRKLSFTKPDGKVLAVAADQLQVAMNRDLAWFPLKENLPTLKIATGKAPVNIGDEVVCLGNSGGGDVITELRGKITGVGPDKIEVDAGFVAGNSGSPVIHVPSGEVIGVATYATQGPVNWTTEQTRFTGVRRFCARPDGAAWKAVGWKAFSDEAAFLKSYNEHRLLIRDMVVDLVGDGLINPAGYDKSPVNTRAAIRGFLTQMNAPKLGVADRLKAQRSFLREMEFALRKGPFEEMDVIRRKTASMCGYHQESVVAEIEYREDISGKLKELEGALTGQAAAMELPNNSFWRPKPERSSSSR